MNGRAGTGVSRESARWWREMEAGGFKMQEAEPGWIIIASLSTLNTEHAGREHDLAHLAF